MKSKHPVEYTKKAIKNIIPAYTNLFIISIPNLLVVLYEYSNIYKVIGVQEHVPNLSSFFISSKALFENRYFLKGGML